MTQEDSILRDLKGGKVITPMDALRDYGCFRLAARIYDLRSRGIDVKTTMVEDHGKQHASYYL